MGYLDDILKTFGFTQDSTVVAIFCILVLLGNFTGGLFANIFTAFGGPIAERKLTERTGFRLAMVSELILILYIAYYHTVLVSGIDTAQLIYWGFTLLAAPLLAALGAQLTYVAFASKIEELKKEYRDFESGEEGEEGADDEDDVIDETGAGT